MKRIRGPLAALALAVSVFPAAQAQEKYPTRPVEVIVPWGPGGGADQTGRMIAKLLESDLKVSFPVINVPGATGNTGMAKLLSAPPDGYSMAILTADTYATQATSTPKWTLKDIIPVAVMIKQPSGLYVAGNSTLKTWAEVEKEARSRPLKVAISGLGSPDEITVNFLNSRGMKLIAVPYAKPGERYTAILGGHADLLYSPVGNIKTYVDGGQMRPVLFLSPDKLAGFADTPTSKQLGYEILLPQFRAVVVRAGTDPARVKYLADALARVYAHPEYKKFLKDATGSDDSFETGPKAVTFMQGELDSMRKALAAVGGK
ncbi:MAG: tripartite tricarboxylate transporter substrate binding protein [Betaproteobacteria bacterium]|nr:tripartite tricarboxylate transporter substrate binding protein [Betaproteobacteria bacterium]